MQLAIPRGRISHTLSEDIKWLASSLVLPLNNMNQVREFEENFAGYVGRKHCISFPFVRTAIYYVLKDLNLPTGSVVLMPPVTIKPILDVVLELGLVPEFVDIDLDTVCFDENELIDSLKIQPRVAILTYLFGIVPNVERITQTLRSANVYIIEDFSQCLNGEFEGKKIGTFGDVSVYSASSVKTLDTYGGGLAVTDDSAQAKSLSEHQGRLNQTPRMVLVKKVVTDLIRNLVTQPVVFSFVTYPALAILEKKGKQEITKFTGDRSAEPLHELPSEWFTSFTSIQAKVGIQQLGQVAGKDKKRVEAIESITHSLGALKRPVGSHLGKNVYWQFIVYADSFQRSQKNLRKHKVDTATTSLVQISNLPKYPFMKRTVNAAKLYNDGAYLPCYHQLRRKQIERIAHALEHINAS